MASRTSLYTQVSEAAAHVQRSARQGKCGNSVWQCCIVIVFLRTPGVLPVFSIFMGECHSGQRWSGRGLGRMPSRFINQVVRLKLFPVFLSQGKPQTPCPHPAAIYTDIHNKGCDGSMWSRMCHIFIGSFQQVVTLRRSSGHYNLV